MLGMGGLIVYGLSVVLWLGYFYAFFRLRRIEALRKLRLGNRLASGA
jgi:hypothetical protein